MIVLLIIVGIVMQLSYARIETLTSRHEAEFSDLVNGIYQQNSVVYYKVFRYSAKTAKLFVVVRSPGDQNANLLGVNLFVMQGEQGWQKADEKLVWATYGSADGWTWPPYGNESIGTWRLSW